MLPLNAIWHVLPVNDMIEHREGMDCPCHPRLEPAGVNNGVVVHNAFDGRVDAPDLIKVRETVSGDKDDASAKTDTCIDCDHPIEFHNAVGCGIPECGCMTEGESDNDG